MNITSPAGRSGGGGWVFSWAPDSLEYCRPNWKTPSPVLYVLERSGITSTEMSLSSATVTAELRGTVMRPEDLLIAVVNGLIPSLKLTAHSASQTGPNRHHMPIVVSKPAVLQRLQPRRLGCIPGSR
jgi:hypothetical protein